jgi:glucan 1,3-beta-glucosidase
MLDRSSAPKFPLIGPVAERDSLLPPLTALLVGALLLPLLARRQQPRWPLVLCGAALGFTALWQAEHALIAYRTPLEWGVLAATGLIALVVAAGLTTQPNWPQEPPRPIAGAYRYLIFALAVANVWLTVDGRYRDFATCLYLPLALVAPLRRWPVTPDERLWGTIALLCALFVWLREAMNGQALLWLITTALITLPRVAGQRQASPVTP